MVEKGNSIEVEKTKYQERKFIDIDLLNTIAQTRIEFKDIPSFADNIKEHGLFNSLLVSRLNKEECENHIYINNGFFKSGDKIENLKPFKDKQTGEDYYYVLISGERRLRAIKHLENNGYNLKERFPGKKIECQVYNDLSWEDFMAIQFSENIHKEIDPTERAPKDAAFFIHMQSIFGEKYHMSLHAKRVGRDEQTVRNSLRFFLLPSYIREMAERKDLSYGTVCQIGRLNEKGVKEGELKDVVIRAAEGKWQVVKAKKEIDKLIEELNSKQKPIFIMTEEDRERMFKETIRKNFTGKMTSGIMDFISYFNIYNNLLKGKILDKSYITYRSKQVLSVFLKMSYTMKDTYPQLAVLLGEEKEEVRKNIMKYNKIAKKILVYSKIKEIFKEVEEDSKRIRL